MTSLWSKLRDRFLPPSAPQSPTLPLLDRAARAEAAGDLVAAIDLLQDEARARPDDALAHRLVRLRRAAFPELVRRASHAGASTSWRPPALAPASSAEPPDVKPDALTPDLVRDHIGRWGCALVRGLVPSHGITRLVGAIDDAFRDFDALSRGEIAPCSAIDPLDGLAEGEALRGWVRKGGGVLAVDAPRSLETLLAVYAELGLDRLIAGYLGERPALSAEKCTLRRADPSLIGGWHQDGSFLGAGIRALNVWIAVSDCGVDAPGLDVVPRRIERLLPTGTNDALPWMIAHEEALAALDGAPLWRPRFQAGDALLFDHLLVHRTAVSPGMTRARYAIESWFFAPSAYPSDQTPIVV